MLKESKFWELMDDEFGMQASHIAASLVLPGLDATAEEALDKGIDPRTVWHAVCDLHEVPESRRLGKIKPR